MNATNKSFSALSLIFLCILQVMSADTVPEPSTILYGKVLHRAYGNEYTLTSGNLEWTLRNQDGVEFTYQTGLQNIKDVFSYKVALPHQALSTGLQVDPSVVPLGQGEDTYEFVSIRVDGFPAAILWSEVDYLNILQTQRAATHRIDLVVSFDLLDSDGDNMPDWWEQMYGLDWQGDDANADLDGDGASNLAEYYNGTDALFDDRIPSVQTLQLAAYGDSNNGVWLRAVDVDNSAADLEYVLTSLPLGGYLHRLDLDVEEALVVGARFTQEDLNEGKLAYRHTDSAVTVSGFSVTLTDGVHGANAYTIGITVFPENTLDDLSDSVDQIPFWWRDENVIFEAYWGLRENVLSGELVESALLYLLGKDYGWTLWDQRQDTLPVTLSTTGVGSHFIIGGTADDRISGGAGDDIIDGNQGMDTLTGGSGIDLFMVSDLGEDVITDFVPGEDVLDIAHLLAGKSGDLDNFVNVQFDGNDTRVGIDVAGSATTYADAVVILQGVELRQSDLHNLWSAGQLVSGAVQGNAVVTFVESATTTIEEGFDQAALQLVRQGPTALPLNIQITYSGSALNGVDYQILFGTVNFKSGEAMASVLVEPLVDGILEGTEQFTASLLPGAGYVLGQRTSSQLAIIDERQRFKIQAIEGLTAVNSDPGLLLITRHGPSSTSTTLFLDVDGSGQRNVDYASIPTFVSFLPYQTDHVIPVIALDGGVLAENEKSRTLTVSLKPSYSESYLLGDKTEAMIRLLSDEQAFEYWARANNTNADDSMTVDELSTTHSSRTGMQALLEYAMSYGVDFDDGIDTEEQAQFRPKLIKESEQYFVEYTQRLNDSRLEYIVEVSDDLTTWNRGPDYFEAVPMSEAEENTGRIRYRILNAEDQNCFVRVLVNLRD